MSESPSKYNPGRRAGRSAEHYKRMAAIEERALLLSIAGVIVEAQKRGEKSRITIDKFYTVNPGKLALAEAIEAYGSGEFASCDYLIGKSPDTFPIDKGILGGNCEA